MSFWDDIFPRLFVGLEVLMLAFVLIASPILFIVSLFLGYPSDTPAYFHMFSLITLAEIVVPGIVMWKHNKKAFRTFITVLISALCIIGSLVFAKFLIDQHIYKLITSPMSIGDYQGTLNAIDAVEQFFPSLQKKDKFYTGLAYLCYAHREYDEGQLESANRCISEYFYYTPKEERLPQEEAFIQHVRQAYKAYEESKETVNPASTEKSLTPTPTPYIRSSSSSSTPYDPYDVYDYDFADDFYYDHYDDFYDYEEAEDYLNEHMDWD